MTVHFSHIHIIGCGLIGSSIARAVTTFELADRLSIADQSDDVVKIAKTINLAREVETDFTLGAKDADLIILATPPGTMQAVTEAIMPVMKSGAILTDVGSVKTSIINQLAPHIRDDIEFVPAHPIAGTENSGPSAGFATLFEQRWCILTPEDPERKAVEKVKRFWEAMGSEVAVMDAARHDFVLATTSHVPHLIAYTLVGTAMDMETVTRNEVVKFSAGGFRDFTRIAASDPVMWRDVFMQNKDSVLEIVDRFIEDLSAIKRAIRWDKDEVLLEHFSKTRDIRRRIVDAGQDSDEPNFGRNTLDD